MRLFTHRRPPADHRGTPEQQRGASTGTGPAGGPTDRTRRRIPHARQDNIAHVRQDNGELVEDVVTSAVVESTAIAEAGGVPDLDGVSDTGGVPDLDGVPAESGDRILWIAPLPKDGDVPVEPTGQVGRMDPARRPDER